jgi:hypothetical protein
MASAKNRKRCFNCDASVHTHATKCPYCGTDLSEHPASPFLSATPPPAPSEELVVTRRVVTAPPYNATPESPPSFQMAPDGPSPPPKERSGSSLRTAVLPMLLLLPGAFFLLFGAILILFSSEGVLTLRWNAHYWAFYLAVALPLLYFGWRALDRVDEQPQSEAEPSSSVISQR